MQMHVSKHVPCQLPCLLPETQRVYATPDGLQTMPCKMDSHPDSDLLLLHPIVPAFMK